MAHLDHINPTVPDMIVKGDSFAGAEFSSDAKYRYRLWRIFDPLMITMARQFAAFVMLNPSTADEAKLDPTLRRCEAFAKTWGYGGFMVANVFALRSTDPSGLLVPTIDPCGRDNHLAIRRVANDCEIVVCGWGAFDGLWSVPKFGGARDVALAAIRSAGRVPHQLGLTKDRHPRHPLYLRADLRAEAMET